MNYVYLLRCADDTYYCGWTTSLKSRVAAHNAGTGAKYTRSRRPVQLVYFEEYEDRHEALSREWHIKRMSREEKISLMERGRKMLETGIKGTLETTVTKDKTACHVGSGELEVYATPMLIALAEETAWKSVAAYLKPGMGTVGTKMNLDHLAATAAGRKVRCETVLTGIEGRKLVFSIEVFDDAGKVAEGTHERFIIDNEKFMAKAVSRGR